MRTDAYIANFELTISMYSIGSDLARPCVMATVLGHSFQPAKERHGMPKNQGDIRDSNKMFQEGFRHEPLGHSL